MTTNKWIMVFLLLASLANQQQLTPYYLLPVQTTQNVYTDYAFSFYTDTKIQKSANVQVDFPFQFDPRSLNLYSSCMYSLGNNSLTTTSCKLTLRSFLINVNAIKSGNITLLIKNILNPNTSEMSSNFVVKTLFKNVVVTQSLQFGKTPFTIAPTQTAVGTVFNYQNTIVEQGSTWIFNFTLAGSYDVNSTVRFVFPEGFSSNKVLCNISGIVDSTMKTRVFPQGNIYDCLNINAPLSGAQFVVLSGIVNPNFQMQMAGLEVQILQPNNLVVRQIIGISNQPLISAKNMNTTITIPNRFRNNTITYIFQINIDSDLTVGDYIQLKFSGNWTFFIQDSKFIEGIHSNYYHKAAFKANYTVPSFSILTIHNFSSITRQNQMAFYVSMRTPLTAATYPLVITAFRSSGGIAEQYSQNLIINATTGYIRQMRLHPMTQAIKLPVGQTGPLQITLGLRNNLPQTNVLTYGKVVIEITPSIPVPILAINGVPKCYFYGDIDAKNCTYVNSGTDPTVTTIIAYTPVDFNFQSSQIPFMVTTQGYVNSSMQGLTIDTLVKRYHFHIQFYTDYSPQPIPTEVVFSDWIADPIAITNFACNQITRRGYDNNHIKCTFTTPNQVLNGAGHIHIFKLQFLNSGWYSALGYTADRIYPDYPCLVYGANILAVPYAKCDLITWTNGPYKSQSSVPYINIYGMQTIPALSQVTIQIPGIRKGYYYSAASIGFTIEQDTYGYQPPFIKLYEQILPMNRAQYQYYNPPLYTSTSVAYTMSNPVINKVNTITLTSFDLTDSGVGASYIVFQVQQTFFPDIGRQQNIACGSHLCSKFNKPHQYFILYPQSTLTRYQNLVFPAIMNPSQAGTYTFSLRVYNSNMDNVLRYSFPLVIQPDTIVTSTYTFNTLLEAAIVQYPNTDRYYTVSWTIVNPLPALTSYIQIFFLNFFTLSSDYCQLQSTAAPYYGNQIPCVVSTGSNKVVLSLMKQVTTGMTFTLGVKMITTTTSASFTPTVSIYTKVSSGNIVDQILNRALNSGAITNTNLATLSGFTVNNPFSYSNKIKKGYFGDLILNFQPRLTSSVTNGYYMIITLTSQFYPYSNALGLPLNCQIGGVRFLCSYTLNPFRVTINNIQNKYSTSSNVINITTSYLQRNGIHHPANPGRYLLNINILDINSLQSEELQQYIDIKPNPITYFNASYAHREVSKHNIFTFQFFNGQAIIPAYDDGTNASKILIGFPLKDDSGATVFTSNLGFTDLPGNAIPCFSENGTSFITPISGKQILCKLHQAPFGSNYAYVEIINFAQIAVGKKMRIFMGKVMNPSSAKVDINFKLKINYRNPTNQQGQSNYQSDFNMFIDMLNPGEISRSQTDSTSTMFQSGSQVGDLNRFINHIPYSGGAGGFKQNDWFIIDMSSQFPLSGSINNCLPNFYKYCIIFKEVNWAAIQINNGTLIPLYPFISQLPTSISRVNTVYYCYTFISQRWSQTITYTITAAQRWMELRGSISGFIFQVLGSQNKLNIGQKNVDVMVTFNVSHPVNRKGTIEIQFPNNSTLVPSIKPHCRSVVTLGSALKGDPTGKPSVNMQGQIGCSVQNTYSWILTSFDTLSAGSQVKIFGQIDFPTILTASLGTGYIATYSNEDASSVFLNGRTIDYIQTNFPLQVQNKTWNLDIQPTMTLTQPLRVGHRGPFTFKLQAQSIIQNIVSGGYIDVSLWEDSILGNNGGFGGPTSQVVCTIIAEATNQKMGCQVSSNSFVSSKYYTYRIQSIDSLAANTVYYITLTTQKGDADQGIVFPTVEGTYKFQVQIDYSTVSTTQVSKAHFIDVYGPAFNVLNIFSTISIPQEPNMLLFEIIPSSSITNNVYKLVIQIPTVAMDGTLMFDSDLGMGYKNYDNLIFDLYQSSVTSMTCKVYTGDQTNNQPVTIVCNQFSLSTITSSHSIKFGFWVKNPSTSIGLAVPIQVYFQHVSAYQKAMWQIIQAGIRVLPTSVSPINDYGNFAVGNSFRQISGISFYLTNRNTKPLLTNDFYIVKFNFDLRNQDKIAGTFQYPFNSYSNSGDTIFMRNCQTILLRVGGSSLANVASGSTTQNILLNGVFYNPSIQLTSSQSQITAYAVYLADQSCEKIIHKDVFPTLVPNQPASPTFTMSPINGNTMKWQNQDYKITFRMSTSGLSDLSLVKKISIQFPVATVYDLKFSGTQCIEDSSSDIQIAKCIIDPSTYTIWIDPVQKGSYINSHQLIFQTVGLAINNPSNTTVNYNQFVIRYYTWSTAIAPTIFPNSDDYVFMKQDATNLASSLSFTSTAYNQHTYLQFSDELYANQFLPVDTSARTPFQFKFTAMTTFSNNSGTTNYHQIRLKFSDYYTYSGLNTNASDLYMNVPICQLNGDRILQCSIVSTEIVMSFLHPITSGSEVSVKFSILNPVDNSQDGFTLINLNTPMITLPVRIRPNGASNYFYMQAQNFAAFYKTSGITYPSMGISGVTATFGTQVYSKLNYLDFSLSFSRNDINGLVLQIPLVKNDGSFVYSNPTLLGLDSGSQYPCSVGINLDIYCYYETGSTTGYGTPTRIYITQFAIQTGNTLSLRLLFTNPNIIGVFPSFVFKAFGGTISNSELMGRQFMGEFQLNDLFKTYPDTNYYSTSSSCDARPSLPLWNDDTDYSFILSNTLAATNYAVLQWVLNDPTYGKVSTYQVDSSLIYDWMTISWTPTNRKVYLIKKYTSTTSFSSLTYGHLRNTHFLQNSNNNIYLLKNPSLIVYNCPTNQSFTNTNRGSNYYGTIAIQNLDIEDRTASSSSFQYMSIDMGSTSPATMLTLSSDPSNMVVVVQFISGNPFSSLPSTTRCSLQAGIMSKDPLNPITCQIDTSGLQIRFRNVNSFTGRYLKFYYFAVSPSSSFYNTVVQLRVYANSQSYHTSAGWMIFYGTSGSFNITQQYFTSNPGYDNNYTAPNTASNGWTETISPSSRVDTGGWVKVNSVASNSISFQMYKGSTRAFSRTHRMMFRFYVDKLSFSGGCSVSSFTVTGKGSGSCSCANKYIQVIYDYYSSSSNAGNNWPTWSGGASYFMTISTTVSGHSGADYLFVTMTYTWQERQYYINNQNGCSYCMCCDGSCPIQSQCTYYDAACYYYKGYPYYYHAWWNDCPQNRCCAGSICYYFTCNWWHGYDSQMLTGRTTPYSPPTTSFFSSASGDLISQQYGYETQLMIQLNSVNINIGPTYNNYILVQSDQNPSHTGNNPFRDTSDSQMAAYIQCKCIVGASVSISFSTTYQNPICVRYKPSGMQPSIGIFINVLSTQSLKCYFPGYTVASSASNNRLNLDFFVNRNHHFRNQIPAQYWQSSANYDAINIGYTSTGLSGSLTFNELASFWNSDQTTNSRYYQLNMSSPHNTQYPTVYMAMYAPQPTTAFCAYSSFSQCRVYTSFINRKYYVVATSTDNSLSYMRWNGTCNQPYSHDSSSSFYTTYIGWGPSTADNRYYHVYTRNIGTSYLSASTPSTSITPPIYGSNLGVTISSVPSGHPTSLTLAVNLNGKTIYSSSATYGQYRGSFIKLTLSGFSSLFDCGATLRNRPRSLDNPFYCQVISSNVLNVYAENTIIMTDFLYITLYTNALPSSTTYIFQLYDKYVSGSDFARTVYISQTFSRTPGSDTLVQKTSVQWRQQTYRQYMTSSGPFRFIMNNNFQYVSQYNESSNAEATNSDALVFFITSGVSSGDSYICFVKQYLAGSRSLYKSFQAPCGYYDTNKIRIKPLPSYTFKPTYFYQFAVYRHKSGETMLITTPASNVFNMALSTVTVLSSETIANYDYVSYYKYKNVYPIVLNSIYILNKEASAINSLYLSYTVNIAGSTFNYFQFQIPNLGLSSFKINNGDRIPCFLSGFTSSESQGVRCLGFSAGINQDSPLKIRIVGLNSWSNPTTFNVAFDNFNNPPLQPLFLVPIDIKVLYNDRTNNQIFRSFWPSVYVSDSVNIGSQDSITGTLIPSNANRGSSTNHYISTNWPYSSTLSDISQKIVLKIGGGVTCCQAFSSLSLSDSQTTYTLLWTNTLANISVYRTPSKSVITTSLFINSVTNPHPYQKDTYEILKTVQVIYYSSYKTVHIKNLAQYNYTQYSALSQFLATSSLTNADNTKSYFNHNQYPMIFDITLDSSVGSFTNRQLSYTIIKFFSGVSNIQWATARYQVSPFYFNSLQQVTFGRDSSNNWYLNVSGMSDSVYSSSSDWYVRFRFYPNDNYVNYTSTTYSLNGQVQFSSSLFAHYIYNNNYRSANNAPTQLQPQESRYTQSYFQLKKSPKFALSGSTNSKIQFRFKTPYSIVNQEKLSFISNSNVDILPVNTPTRLYCIIQQTISSKVKYGVGRWTTCSFSTNTFTLTNPIGGLTANTQYTLTILQRNQTTTSFVMPTTPKRIQISLIYTSELNLQYGDVYQMDFSGLMSSYSVNHLATGANFLNMIGFTFTPRFTLITGSVNAPIIESMLQVSIPTKYIDKCAGVDSLFSTDSMYFASGTYFSHFSTPAVTDANTRLRCGDYSQSYAPLKLSVTDYGQFTAGTSYYFRFPLLKNPGTQNSPFTYTVRLLRYDTNVYYPIIANQFTYQNLQKVQSPSTSWVYSTLNQSSSVVQGSVNVGFYYDTFIPSLGRQVLIKWSNNALLAFTSITNLTSLSSSSYSYQYYPNINLCVFVKTVSNTVNYLSLGSFTTSIDQQSYRVSWVYTFISQTTMYYGNFNPNSYKVNTLLYYTSWSTRSITKLYGIQTTHSMGLYMITFASSALTFPQGSYIIIQITSTLSILDEFCQQFTGFSQGTILTTSNLACRRYQSDKLIITGYGNIGVGTTLTVTQYMQVNTASIGNTNIIATITVYSKNNNIIISGSTPAYVLSRTRYGGYYLQLPDQMNYDLMQNAASQFFFTFQLRSNSLTAGRYLTVDFGNWTIDPATLGNIMCKYKVGTNPYWVPFVFSKLSGNIYKMLVYTNQTTYSIPSGQLITVWIYHVNPDSFNGVLVSNTTWNYLKISACDSDGTVLQHQFSQQWVQPFEHISFNVVPALKYINAVSLYEFTVTPNVSVSTGHFISIEFTTDDEYYNNLFSTTLGKTVAAGSFLQISCRQTSNARIISDNNIKCLLYPGDISLSPSIPTTIKIFVEKDIPINTLISFNVLSLQNPSVSSYPVGVTFKLSSSCYSLDQNNPCTYYKSTKYLTFNSVSIPPSTTSSFGSLTFSPNIISATNAQHTISASISLAVGDFVQIVYYSEVTVPQMCNLVLANAVCYSYPLENTIVIKVLTAQSSPYSFTLTGMTNLYKYQGSSLFTQIWKLSTGTISNRFNTQYNVGIIYTDPVSSNPLAITFSPTLTTDYQLKYGFQNIAKIEISYIMQNSNIQQIFIQAPSSQITLLTYCNATMTSDNTQAKPYPYRFQCQVLNSYQVRLTKQSDFPAWVSNHINRKVVVYLMYIIANGVGSSCSNWYATAFTDTTSSTNPSSTSVSQAVGNFNVINYMSPHIYQINFPTQSFSQRTCTTGELCMFYGYLLPSTLQANYQISYINFGIPKEFGYSNLVTYTNCDMMQSNADATTVTCVATRNNSQVSIKYTPSPTYNMNYKLITIDTSNSSQLFKSPAYPGDQYQMKVDLYTNTQLLIESQLINITTVYGVLLDYNYINVIIPQDASTTGLFQFSFKVGTSDILPSYPNTKSNTVTSSIQIIFSNTFLPDLGTGFIAGQEISCLPILGLTLNTMAKLTCRIYPSVSTITYPTIVVTGYDKILAGTTVSIRAAGLKSLPVGIKDYVKIGVSLTYFDYGGSKGFLYQPTGKIVGPTTAPASTKTVTGSVTESSSNFVGQLTNYTFTCLIDTSAGFNTIKTTDYIGVQFPSFGFQGRFSMNEKALCSIASSSKCLSFGLANVVYFQPATAISSSTLNFNLNQMINTAFAYQYVNLTIKVFSVVDNSINALGSVVLNKFSKPSTNISGLITKVDSIYGGESGINYYIDFKLGTYLPQYGKISIVFPSVFTSLFTLKSSCNFSQSSTAHIGDGSFCEVVNDYQIIISANGHLFDSSQTYQIIVSNLTNPNMNISGHNLLISSYYSNDIYSPYVISSSSFKGPSINILSVKSCQFELSVQALNENHQSNFNIILICPSFIKQASELQIYLPWFSRKTTGQLCSSSTNSLYSYQCDIQNAYVGTSLFSYLSIYLRQNSPQKQIQISGQIVNGIRGTYTLKANISFSGFTYLTAVSNQFYLQQSTLSNTTSFGVNIANYPLNSDYPAIYTFRMTNPNIAANSLKITFPSQITEGKQTITCRFQKWNSSMDYFNLLVNYQLNNLPCFMSGQILTISNISTIISNLTTNQFWFLVIGGLTNPDISSSNSTFNFTFMNLSSDNTGLITGSISRRLAYKVSPPPRSMQIKSIQIDNNKLGVLSKYVFGFSTISGNNIVVNSQSKVGIKILFPSEYLLTWQIIQVPSTIKLTLGTNVFISSNISMISGKLLSYFDIPSNQQFSNAAVQFVFRNPSVSLNCSVTPVFTIGLFDFKLNSLIAQTISNKVDCPKLSGKLYSVNISGNSQIQAGGYSNYSIQIQQPAYYLLITPKTSATAISFSPKQILFSGYNNTVKYFDIIASSSFSGQFVVEFDKTQTGGVYYNDISNQTVTVIEPVQNYVISFDEVKAKSIGLDIPVTINFSVPPDTSFDLVYTHNCSSHYKISPSDRIALKVGSYTSIFSISYSGDTIPLMCTIRFKISSLTANNYALQTNILYVSATVSKDKTKKIPPMIMRVTKSQQLSQFVGFSIFNSNSTQTLLRPVIYELNQTSNGSNSVSMLLSGSEPGQVYFVALSLATQRKDVTHKLIYQKNISTGVSFGNASAQLVNTGNVNIRANFAITGLEASSVYLVAAYINSSVGLSDLHFQNIKTSKSSNGAVLKLALSSIQPNSTLINALSTVLRIQASRMSVIKINSPLDSVIVANPGVLNSRKFVYQIVVAPNTLNDASAPISILNAFINSSQAIGKLGQQIAALDLTYKMSASQLIYAKPRIRRDISIIQLTNQIIKISISSWQKAKFYGVIVPYDENGSDLLSKQIIDGLDRNNKLLTQAYRSSNTTQDSGEVQLTFRLLMAQTKYQIFVTAESVIPYDPKPRLSDDDILYTTLATTANLNVAGNQKKIIQTLIEQNQPELAQAVRQHILSVEQKKMTNDKPKRIRRKKN